jgi:heptosyltransferase-2
MTEKQIITNRYQNILIVRFSSIGDIIQCMSVLPGLKIANPKAVVHWIVRSDMATILEANPYIDRIHIFKKEKGLIGLIRFVINLRRLKFDLIYDAHKNIRSAIVRTILTPLPLRILGFAPKLVVRNKIRFRRFLFFKLGIRSAIKMPFKSFASFKKPLEKINALANLVENTPWRFSAQTIAKTTSLTAKFASKKWICLVPSAAHELKKWPVSYFQALIRQLPEANFVIIGGPNDTFCEEIAATAPEQTINLAGQTNLMESFHIVYSATAIVSGDTGFMHAADLFRKPTIALIGPSAFGFPSNPEVVVQRSDLKCMPCSKDGSGKCKAKTRKQCMLDINPKTVAKILERITR